MAARPSELVISQTARRTQQVRSEEARARLLAASVELICERGFAQTTMGDIAKLAGFTRGAIQHHFEGRDDLVLAIIHSVERQIIASLDAVAPDAVHDLGSRIDFLVESLGAISASRSYLAVVDIWVATRADEQLGSEVRKSMLRSSESFKRLWSRTFSDDAPPSVISECRRIVVTLMRGIAISQALIQDDRLVGPVVATCKAMVRHHMMSQTREVRAAGKPRRASKT